MSDIVRVPLEDLPLVTKFPIRYLRNAMNLRLGSIKSYFTRGMFENCFIDRKNPLDELRIILDDNLNFRIEKNGKWIRDIRPRFGHIDLGLRHDSTGVALVYLDKIIKIEGQNEIIPIIGVDFVGRISSEVFPDKEVVINSVTSLFFECKKRGGHLALITLDGFQNVSAKQGFNHEGILSDRLSIDNTVRKILIKEGRLKREPTGNPGAAMDSLWLVLKQKRLRCPRHEWLLREAAQQEKDERTGKVRVVQGGTDDVIQALAGAVLNVTENLSYANTTVTEEMSMEMFDMFAKEEAYLKRMLSVPMKNFAVQNMEIEKEDISNWAYEDPGEYYGDDIYGDFH